MNPNPSCPEEVELHTNAWVCGMRAATYFGPVKLEREGGDMETMMCEAIDDMQLKAFHLGANAVVGVELMADPFERSVRIIGTAAHLEPLY